MPYDLDPNSKELECQHEIKGYHVENDTENWLIETCKRCGEQVGILKLEQSDLEKFYYQVEIDRLEQDTINKDVKQVMDKINNLITSLGQQTVASEWVTSDHVTECLEKFKEEDEEEKDEPDMDTVNYFDRGSNVWERGGT